MELALLILEAALLTFTVILLVMSIKEGRSRDALIMQVDRATRILTRHEYFLSLNDAMLDAKESVLGSITGRLPTGQDSNRTRELVNHIQRLTSKGVAVRYVLPKFHDRLHVGYLYSKAGAQVLGCFQ